MSNSASITTGLNGSKMDMSNGYGAYCKIPQTSILKPTNKYQ